MVQTYLAALRRVGSDGSDGVPPASPGLTGGVKESMDEASFQSLPEAVTEATRPEEAAQAE